jgi:glycine C-acetyltransferase
MQTEVLSLYLRRDAIISDSLNASIIDGVRLCKAARYRYANCDMEDLEQLIKANEAGSRFKIIVTDGVFSMDGVVAPLDKICDLADKYDAMVMIDVMLLVSSERQEKARLRLKE